MHVNELKAKTASQLLSMAEALDIESIANMSAQSLIFSILRETALRGESIKARGVIEVAPEGFGFLRSPESNYLPGADDIYVSHFKVKKYSLKTGDTVEGEIVLPGREERYFAMDKISSVNFDPPEKSKHRINFDALTPLYPNEKINLEVPSVGGKNANLSGRVIDIIAPFGKGQRALITAPPRSGKTMIIQSIAHAIEKNHPEIHLIVLLVDERPEEVTDMSRTVKGEVVSSTFDEPAIRHVQVSEMVIEKAKRLVEHKKDVVILLDNITRLARAYNATVPSSGKVLTGGVDVNALQRPKRFFGAARNVESGGSLTIIATALIETGSKMDEVIFEEFKGTGNSEVVLDRKLSEKRIYPAIDIAKSGTRKEDLLLEPDELSKVWVLRRVLDQMGSPAGVEFFLDKLKKSKNNDEFFMSMNS